MEHNDIRYSVIQTIGGAGERAGEARNRHLAILEAIKQSEKTGKLTGEEPCLMSGISETCPGTISISTT
jgi:hypothetical protein